MRDYKAEWTTVAMVGYTGPVSRDENHAAHGGLTRLQVRNGSHGLQGRQVNTNGRHEEVGEAFALDEDTLNQWECIAKADR